MTINAIFSVKLSHDEKALENFNRALKIAEVLDDKAVQDAITKAIQDVNYRIAESELHTNHVTLSSSRLNPLLN